MMLRIKLGGLWSSAGRFKQIPEIKTPPILQLQHRFSSAAGNSSSEMGVTKEQVESSLQSKLSPSHLEVIDTSGGCGASFAVAIVSEQFEGKRLLERHRMVNAALTEEMKDIHALSITKAVTPEQWKKQQESERPAT